MKRAPHLDAGIVGREADLSALKGFLQSAESSRALVLSGGPGVGKTTLWEAGVETARQQGARVLSARPNDAEARLAFAALIDLLDGVETDELSGVPAPQLEALEVALLRAVPTGPPPETHAIALGFLNAVRALAARDPLLVAVDDVQWLDPPSAAALTFVARRLGNDRIAVLLAKRPGPSSPLEDALASRGLERLEIGPLSLGATRRVLRERLGLTLPRRLLRQIFDATLGNPLFALEVGRKLVEDGLPGIGEELPVPDAVDDILGTRVAGLPASVRRSLLAVALSPNLRVGQLAMLGNVDSLTSAVGSGVLVTEGEHVRASHPLLAAAVVRNSRAAERRELHRILAGVVVEEELRTRHLALAASRPDADLAATVASAASEAAGRGAPLAAVELADHALRLTPRNHAERTDRVLELAGYLEIAGEKRRVTELLESALAWLPAGPARARAWVLLVSGEIRGNDDIKRFLANALDESGEDVRSRAAVLAALSENTAAVSVERIREAESWALEALDALAPNPGAEPRLERIALYALAWARSLGGRPIDDVCERFRVSSPAAYIAESPERVAGQRLVWRGEVTEARIALTRLLVAADERGEPSSYALQRLHVCELELRVGDWDPAARLLDDWADSAEGELLHWPMYERCRALLAAGRGLPDEGRRWAEEAIARAEETGVRWDLFEASRASGVIELLVREPARAVEGLRPVWEHAEREGVDDPGAFPVAPELVEALVELGELGEALSVTNRLGRLADDQEHPWGRATAQRCRALVRLAQSYDERAATDLEDAAREYESLGLTFERARSLLNLGRAQRRFKKWGSARHALQEAAVSFDTLGSPGWAEAARSELARSGARRSPKPGALTPAERRVAELAAEGLANKEIARTLIVTVNTVEFHLSNVYAKLGVRSRGQLAGRLARQPPRDPRR